MTTEQLGSHAIDVLRCPIGMHLIENPITNHCGHTFCKLCLLRYKIANDTCCICQKRLPSFQYLQKQPTNHILNNILTIINNDTRYSSYGLEIAKTTSLSKNTTQLLPSTDPYSNFANIPINVFDFPVLPYQKLRIPIFTEKQRSAFIRSLLACQKYQCFCLGIISKQRQDVATFEGHKGTIVKVKSVDQRSDSLIIDIQGLDRFKVINIHEETDDLIYADIELKLESQINWTSPMMHNSTPPSATAIKLSSRIHNFISELAYSNPTNSFCSAVDGLLGPVWLDSVQSLHGVLPSPFQPVVICWWSGIVLPVGNSERYNLLQTSALEDRLKIILSWIQDLESQWVTCKRTALNTAVKVSQQQ
ncbi:hypothetical protein BDF20DRAFT_818075 [Mycotypha africana]|uniref:uncharacterized protein n=1 Tax=Mycotypha africana TaxID=64632 RepID=UPI002300104E|nr:uncharacterized protein BDF20DRAFT_818075 [Mycotypha africana]KAI8982313.1 hypothetical protein BDF20DRAFT_818075 [Mycotypha africana]